MFVLYTAPIQYHCSCIFTDERYMLCAHTRTPFALHVQSMQANANTINRSCSASYNIAARIRKHYIASKEIVKSFGNHQYNYISIIPIIPAASVPVQCPSLTALLPVPTIAYHTAHACTLAQYDIRWLSGNGYLYHDTYNAPNHNTNYFRPRARKKSKQNDSPCANDDTIAMECGGHSNNSYPLTPIRCTVERYQADVNKEAGHFFVVDFEREGDEDDRVTCNAVDGLDDLVKKK
eukprot:365790_1